MDLKTRRTRTRMTGQHTLTPTLPLSQTWLCAAVWGRKAIDFRILDFAAPTSVFLRDCFARGLTAWTTPYGPFAEGMRCPFLDARAMEYSPAGFTRPHGFVSLDLESLMPHFRNSTLSVQMLQSYSPLIRASVIRSMRSSDSLMTFGATRNLA
jgi:hypothetical protein